MFSGGDSTGEGVNGMNPFGNFQLAAQSAAACGLTASTTASGSIDWASLAQQWIQMRDYSGTDIGTNMPDAPPPPKISANFDNVVVERRHTKNDMQVSRNTKKTKFEEKGEADMDMDDDDEDNGRSAQHQLSTYGNRVPPVDQIMQPNWFMQQPIGPLGLGGDMSTDPQQPGAQWNVWPSRPLLSTPVVNANATTPPLSNSSTAHIPSLMKINVPDPNIIKSMPESSNDNNASSTMDAAKRKILPAWIREGLEKMEREKQRQLERQQKKSNTLSEDDSNSQTANDTPPLSGAHMVNNKIRSTMESDSSGNEEDDNERTVAYTATSSIEKNKTASQSYTDGEEEDYQTEQAVEAVKTGKSYEQKLSDLMIVVRKTLTELLLEVTNEEICSISNETIKSLKTKATSAQLIPKSAISTITGKLGLAAYDDSSDESSGSDSEKSNKNESYADSEEEIKANLRMKRKTFAKTSEEIEEHIAESALREEQKLKFYTEQEQHLQAEEQQKLTKTKQDRDNQREFDRSGSSSSISYKVSGRALGSTTVFTSGKGYEKEFGETPDSKLQFSNGKRQKERTTRFSDIKDLKSAPIKAADYISQFKNSQIETAAQKINTALLQIPVDGPTSSTASTVLPPKHIDTLPPFNAMLGVKRESKSESSSKHKTSSSKRESNQKSRRRSSDDNDDDDSTSDSSDSSDSSSRSSNSSRNSSKHSGISSSSTKRKSRHYHRSSSSTKKSNRDRKKSHDRGYRDRHYDNHKSSRRRYHSSESDDYDDGDYQSSKKHRSSRSTHHRRERYRERKSNTRTRSRSKSRSRSRSSYSSSRRRH